MQFFWYEITFIAYKNLVCLTLLLQILDKKPLEYISDCEIHSD